MNIPEKTQLPGKRHIPAADDNIDLAIEVQVAHGKRIRNDLAVAERHACGEHAILLIEIN